MKLSLSDGLMGAGALCALIGLYFAYPPLALVALGLLLLLAGALREINLRRRVA